MLIEVTSNFEFILDSFLDYKIPRLNQLIYFLKIIFLWVYVFLLLINNHLKVAILR